MSDSPILPTTVDPLDEVGGRALVESWQGSGLSGAAFCRARNLRPQRLHYWRERLGYPIKVLGAKRLATPSSSSSSDGFVQVVVRDQEARSCTYVGIVVGGAEIRVSSGFDADLLRSVVSALREA